MLASRSAWLKVELRAHVLEQLLGFVRGVEVLQQLVEALELDHHGSAKTLGTEVRRASAHVTKGLVPHALGARQVAKALEYVWGPFFERMIATVQEALELTMQQWSPYSM